ncbi:MAG: histidinol-phosphatase [Clostridia bacterium]|nr:histidinol-phosphatase [Clostridia bacterium]
MKYLQNLHTHTTYCDGADTPEQMIVAALEKGFDSIGFSEHSYAPYSLIGGMSPPKTEQYKNEIRKLADQYKDRIEIFCGLEFDMFSPIDLNGYDFLIGSVHYLECGGVLVGFNRSAEAVQKIIDEHFCGDGMRYVRAYYEALAELPKYGSFDMIGHFDLITKHSEKITFFDETSKEYRNYALQAAESLKGKIPLFEVNTGAMARGNRTTPYPSVFLLKELKQMGYGVCITSDCHDARMLDCGFDDAEELLKSCGYTEKYILTGQGFIPVAL